jgi:hypothetical protein
MYSGIDTYRNNVIGECLITESTVSINGAWWDFAGSEHGLCLKSAMGEDMFVSEGVAYVVSRGRMEGLAAEGNEVVKDEKSLEWFKEHADMVVDMSGKKQLKALEAT